MNLSEPSHPLMSGLRPNNSTSRKEPTRPRCGALVHRWLVAPFLLLTAHAGAQEFTTPIAALRPLQEHAATQRVAYQLDTINLPLIDDFSRPAVWPSPSLWTDNLVYVNADLSVSPPTLGVATFDGLDANGRAYDGLSPTSRGLADRMSSQAVNLQNLSPADSVYLSFFWQPAGLGEQPESTDSLALEFLAADSLWYGVWSQRGLPVQPFRPQLCGLLHPRYFHSGFRFRFSAYGSLTGLVDLWHLDYVKLARARNVVDTLFTDVAIKEQPNSPLAPYRRIPYRQLLTSPGLYPVSPVSLPVTNLGNSDRNVAHSYTCLDAASGSVVQSVPLQIISPFTAQSSRTIDYPAFPIPAGSSDSLNLDFTYAVQASPDDRRANDTLRTRLSLWNDFAYDDGTAETGYGINLLGASVAYKFYVATPDTLRGVWMYFIQAAENAAQELFNLKIWSAIGENTLAGNETVLTQQELQRPRYADSFGVFVFYPLDTPVLVRDSFYVGWQQLSNRLLNIGLDRNSPVQGVKWTSVLGNWQASGIAGSWMIRPVLADSLSFPTPVVTLNRPGRPWLYPNPTYGQLYVHWDLAGDDATTDNAPFDWQLRDVCGRMVARQTLRAQQVPEALQLASGVYYSALYRHNRLIQTQKIIIKH